MSTPGRGAQTGSTLGLYSLAPTRKGASSSRDLPVRQHGQLWRALSSRRCRWSAFLEVIRCETDEGGDLLAILAHREGTAIESDSGIAETHAEC